MFGDTTVRPMTWKMQFPIAIDADARCFTVLRTLYIFKIECDPIAALESIALDVEFGKCGRTQWHESEDLVSSDAITDTDRLDIQRPLNLRGLYLYWTAFSPDSRFLLFIEQDLSGYANTAMHKICESPELGVSLVGHTSFKSDLWNGQKARDFLSLRNLRIPAVTMHHRYPLAAFVFAGQLFIWPYDLGK